MNDMNNSQVTSREKKKKKRLLLLLLLLLLFILAIPLTLRLIWTVDPDHPILEVIRDSEVPLVNQLFPPSGQDDTDPDILDESISDPGTPGGTLPITDADPPPDLPGAPGGAAPPGGGAAPGGGAPPVGGGGGTGGPGGGTGDPGESGNGTDDPGPSPSPSPDPGDQIRIPEYKLVTAIESVSGGSVASFTVPILVDALPPLDELRSRSIEIVVPLPDELYLVGVTASENITGAVMDHHASGDRVLRIAYIVTDSASPMGFTVKDEDTEIVSLTFRLNTPMPAGSSINVRIDRLLAIADAEPNGARLNFLRDINFANRNLAIINIT